ncbi:hypothetical protein J6A64_07510 [bacterium]|nr:hypothetical protein [bacterium]
MDFSPQISFKASPEVSSTNLLDKYKQVEKQVTTDTQKDSVVIHRDLIADLQINKEKASIGTIVEGHVNKKPAIFKVVTNNEEETWFEGLLNKKYLLMHCKDKVYDGKYDNQDFILSVDYNEPSKLSNFFNEKICGKTFRPDYFHVKGRIGNKAVDITLPNTKIPKDSMLKDLLTMVLEDNGLKAQIIGDEIKSLKFSATAVKNIKYKAEKREKMINNDIKPLFMQALSTISGTIIGAMMTALMLKLGFKR